MTGLPVDIASNASNLNDLRDKRPRCTVVDIEKFISGFERMKLPRSSS